MQRKSNILIPNKLIENRNNLRVAHRKGFAIVMAMGAIVIIAGIMAASLSLTSQTSKRTTDIYLYEQAELYAKSAAERTLLQIAANAPCVAPVRNYNLDNNIYNINVDLLYIYTAPSPCATASGTDYLSDANTITTDEQDGSVLMDITVTTNAGTEPIRIFKRTIQKL